MRDDSPLVGDILGPSDNLTNAPQTRWDVFMDPADPVAAVVQELLAGPVGAAFASRGPDAVLRECSP